MDKLTATMDGNTAAAHAAYRVNEVIAIFPITPSSTMAELADEWAAAGVPTIWGNQPVVQAMQSEGGAAGAVHGALQSGALTTTFTASQGLMLMLPNMFKIAGELTATVFHVAARSLATQALSIFGDHSDVMAARSTGFALLASASVQEAHDMATVAQAATLASTVPFMHFFDGFRTSHEVNTVTLLTDAEIRAMIDEDLVRAHRARALNPERPVVRGTAHNPDTFFQARETVNPFYARVPGIVQSAMDRFAGLTGRQYHLFDYHGPADADRAIVLMGSGAETARMTAAALSAQGEKVGVLQVRLYRPFAAEAFLAALPDTVRAVAVMDRTKEPGATGEPLYLDVVATLATAVARGERAKMPLVIGGRYGLSSKDFSPAMAKAVFDELKKPDPKRSFTVGITDDVAHTSLAVDPTFSIDPPDVVQAVFYGLGADGTVGANKNSVKIIAEDAALFAQGYFVYDSHKSGAQTVSHLRFGPRPIHAPYLIQRANFVACHKFDFVERTDVLRLAAPGATFLLNSPYGPDEVWDHLPRAMQKRMIALKLRFFVIDASKVAQDVGLRGRTNTVLQTCFFAISGVMPQDKAISHIKASIRKTYGRRGEDVVRRNFQAVDDTLARLFEVHLPLNATSRFERPPIVPAHAPLFVREVTARMMEGLGDDIPVSLMPIDGTFPSGTAAWEKRNIAEQVPVWEPDLCVQCGQCSFVCPHSVIRAKYYDEDKLAGAPDGFKSAAINARGFPNVRFTLQFWVEDCTGCGLCTEACPALSPVEPGMKAINLRDKLPLLAAENLNLQFFQGLPINDRARVDFANVRGVQYLEPLFEFSGACGGCGETPYLKLLSQLFGDRMMVANATGCSSIYGGNLPVTPWSKNREGRGPAWSNSLFEDNAEFGLGFRLAADKHLELATTLARGLAPRLGADLVEAILAAPQRRESEIQAQRARVATLIERLQTLGDDPAAKDLLSVVDHLVRRSIWIVGGDGWAYDIGYGGLDHVLATSRDVNILVLDTEVYSNTGGQASKATPLGAVAKFAAAGKRVARKDLALQAIAYGNVYVAQVAMGANPQQTLLAFREAEIYPGPSLILAYSHCVAHGIDMQFGMRQQDLAAASGYWPLFRYDPAMRAIGENPFRLDSPRPTLKFRDYAYNEIRYSSLARTRPAEAEQLLADAQAGIEEKYRLYEEMAGWGVKAVPEARAACELIGTLTMDLATSYLGLTLKHPLIASSSPLTGEIDNLRKLEDAGAAAVVLPSIFEEQIESEAAEYERLADTRTDSFPEALSYFPPSAEFALGPHRYLELIHRARGALEIPVIASLNGSTSAGWTDYAKLIQHAGASALELNSFFVPVDAALDGRAVEQRHLDVLRAVKEVVTLPIAVKLSPYFSAVGDLVRRLDHAGANGFVLFNRFYQPDIDLPTMRLSRNLDLSTPAEIRLPLLWIGVLAGQVRGALAAATGVESAAEAVKYLLVGADVVMTTSALLRYGIGHMNTLLADLTEWLDARGVTAINDIRGKMSRERLGDPPAFERANYISILHGWTGGA